MDNTINDRHPNFRGEDGKLYLVRCFACSPEYGEENWAPAVASGACEHCGWSDRRCAECGDQVPDAHTPYGELGLNCGRGECLESMLERADRERVEIELEDGARMTACLPVDVAPETMSAITAVGNAAAKLLASGAE
jgi:hypothetical protein